MNVIKDEQYSIAGLSFSGRVTRDVPVTTAIERTAAASSALAAGVAGTLTTRTDDNTGVVTAAGHALIQNDVVTVFWTGGIRYGMTVGVVAGDDVPVDGGAGDVLPADETAVVIAEQDVLDVDFDGDLVELIAIKATGRAHLVFAENDDTVLHPQELTAGEPWSWASGQGTPNPLTGDPVGKIKLANGTTAAIDVVGGIGREDA